MPNYSAVSASAPRGSSNLLVTNGTGSLFISQCQYPRIAPSKNRYVTNGPFPRPCVGTSLHIGNYLT